MPGKETSDTFSTSLPMHNDVLSSRTKRSPSFNFPLTPIVIYRRLEIVVGFVLDVRVSLL